MNTSKKTTTAAKLTSAIPASVRDIENWIARLELSTQYDSPERGKPRLLSRRNALELGFIAGLVRGGATPARAAIFAKSFLRMGRDVREWFVFPAGDLTRGDGSDQPDLDKLSQEYGAVTLSFIRLGEIVRNVDELLEQPPLNARGEQ